MRRCLLALWLFAPLTLLASASLVLSEDEDPASYQHVNVITGHLNVQFQDAVIPGAVPYTLSRSYSSQGATLGEYDHLNKWASNKFSSQGGWSFFPHVNLFLQRPQKERHKGKKDYIFFLEEKNGMGMKYEHSHKEEGKDVYKPILDAPPASTTLNARTNPQNHEIHFDNKEKAATLYLADGSVRYYERAKTKVYQFCKQQVDQYTLIKEVSPDKYEIHYEYDSDRRLKKIRNKGPKGRAQFSKIYIDIKEKMGDHRPFHFKVRASTGEQFEYKGMIHEERQYLKSVTSNCRADEHYHYIPSRRRQGARLQSLSIAGHDQFNVSYYLPDSVEEARAISHKSDKKRLHIDRVKELQAPIGSDGSWKPLANFVYMDNLTEVRDQTGQLIRYHHDGSKVLRIEYFDSHEKIHSTVQFFWQGSYLTGKALLDASNAPIFSKTFTYSDTHDVIQETFYGNLSGNATSSFTLLPDGAIDNAESYSRFYTYDPNTHLRLSESEENGLTTHYTYLPETTLPTFKITTKNGQTLARESFRYNDDHLLIEKRTEDAEGSTTISRYTLDPRTALPVTLAESYLENNREVQLQRIEYIYSSQNRVIAGKLYNAEDDYLYTIHTEYDMSGKILSRTTPSGYKNTYAYGPQGELLSQKEQGQPPIIHTYSPILRLLSTTEANRTTHFSYDLKGRLTSQTDPEGNVTTQSYDDFGRCIETTFPPIEEAGHPTVHFAYDTIGNIIQTNETHTTYNAYRQPITITDPTGDTTFHTYSLSSDLLQTTYSDGTTIHYTYDDLHRKTSETTLSPSQTILSQETWTYTGALLLSHTNAQGLTTHYTHDGASRLTAATAEERTKTYTYNANNLLSQETTGDTTQHFLYDLSGNIIRQYTSTPSIPLIDETCFTYDSEGRKIQAIRHESTDHFTYDAQNRLTSHTDPLGNTTQFIYTPTSKTTIDPLNLATIETYDALGHLISVEKQNTHHQTIAFTAYRYDLHGNQIKRITTVYDDTTPIRTLTATWKHDPNGRIIEETEHPSKTTTYTYTPRGDLSSTTLPSGTTIYYTYDHLRRLTEKQSSDGTVHYRYHYSNSLHPTQVDDLVHQTTLFHTYNLFNELTAETNAYNLTTTYTYDSQGRRTYQTLPDKTTISYTYDGPYLTSVQRPTYTHTYNTYTPHGLPAQETTIYNQPLSTTYDLLERPLQKTSLHHQETLTYGPSGLILSRNNTLFSPIHYSYDPLNQLIQENTTTHSFDSLGNPTNATINHYNQIVSDNLTYDPQGNPLSHQDNTYTYDALNRLICHNDTTYIYDHLDRLIRKDDTLYLYDHLEEIGTHNQTLKVLGYNSLPIAIELDNTPYAPIVDTSNNLVALTTTTLHETYPTDAFGTIIHQTTNPWRFSCKRTENNLVLFGKRFYDPSLQRFLTPDPAGPIDSPNLYLFVLNNPVNRLDRFGLSAESFNTRPAYTPTPAYEQPQITYPIHTPSFTSPFDRDIVHAKGRFGLIEMDFIIVGQGLHHLNFTPEEESSGRADIFNHLSELLPSTGSLIGIVSLQNGMLNRFSDLQNSSEFVWSALPGPTLFISPYNPHNGIFSACKRVNSELKGVDTDIVIGTRQFFASIAECIHKINPSMLWLHLSHSEGGLIAHNAIAGMTPEQQARMQTHMLSASFGPPGLVIGSGNPRLIPNHFVRESQIIYSERDFLTNAAGHRFRDDKRYNIQFKVKKELGTSILPDHELLGETYKAAVKEVIDDYQKRIGIYNPGFR